ncbi:hypothetical protein HDV57DRAFT_387675 [Trichoderma longibrachiatum]
MLSTSVADPVISVLTPPVRAHAPNPALKVAAFTCTAMMGGFFFPFLQRYCTCTSSAGESQKGVRQSCSYFDIVLILWTRASAALWVMLQAHVYPVPIGGSSHGRFLAGIRTGQRSRGTGPGRGPGGTGYNNARLRACQPVRCQCVHASNRKKKNCVAGNTVATMGVFGGCCKRHFAWGKHRIG